MIEINLIPPNLRKKKRKTLLPGGFNIPLEVVIGLGGGLLMMLVFLHIGLLVVNISKIGAHKNLKKQWAVIEPDKNKADAVIQEMRALQSKLKAIQDLTGAEKVVWAEKLNILSDSLPGGVWLNKVALSGDVLFIDGSAISRQKKEMINVHSFTAKLQENSNFLKNLSDLELGSIQRKNIQKTEIADFLITAKIK